MQYMYYNINSYTTGTVLTQIYVTHDHAIYMLIHNLNYIMLSIEFIAIYSKVDVRLINADRSL